MILICICGSHVGNWAMKRVGEGLVGKEGKWIGRGRLSAIGLHA